MGEFSTRDPHTPLPSRKSQPSDRHVGRGFVVTGAAGGIGRATAELLLAEGARVVLADVNQRKLEATIGAIGDARFGGDARCGESVLDRRSHCRV